MSKTILRPRAAAEAQTKTISLRVPMELATRIDRVKDAATACDMAFPLTDLVVEFLHGALTRAEKELQVRSQAAAS